MLGPSEVSKVERVFERDGVLRWTTTAAAAVGSISSISAIAKQTRIDNSDDKTTVRNQNHIVGYARIGVSVSTLLDRVEGAKRHRSTGAREMQDIKLSDVLRIFESEGYVLWRGGSEGGGGGRKAQQQHDQQKEKHKHQDEVVIVLKQGCEVVDQLKAWAHALVLSKRAFAFSSSSAAAASLSSSSSDVARRGGKDGKENILSELIETRDETNKLFDAHLAELKDAGWDLEIGALETKAGTRAVIMCIYRKGCRTYQHSE